MAHGVYAVNSRVIFAVLLLQSVGPLAHAQPEEKTEANAAAKIIQARGRIATDRDGRVIDIYLLGNTDEQIESIDFSVFSALESISISCPKMTNRSLIHLRKLPPGLLTLKITNGRIDDKELAPLIQRQKSLLWLSLRGTAITDHALLEIGKLEKLSCLCLDSTKITDRGLKHLANLQHLLLLELSFTQISDAGLLEIKQMERLGGVNLRGTSVTDLGIRELGRLERLHWLDVSDTKVTDAGKRALKQLVPDLEFEK